jgi:hypothetical protein
MLTRYMWIVALLLILVVAPTAGQELEDNRLENDYHTTRMQILSKFAYLTTYNIAGLLDDPLWRDTTSQLEFVAPANQTLAYLATYDIPELATDPLWQNGSAQIIASADGA